MLRLKTIIDEMKDVPENRLEDVFQFVHALNVKTKKKDAQRKKILSYAGAFSDMPEKDYAGFVRETKRVRASLFIRSLDL